MSRGGRADGGTALTLAIFRATLLSVIVVSLQLVAYGRLASTRFYTMLGLATVYSVAGIVLAIRQSDDALSRMLWRMQPVCDVFFLCGLAATSGGAFSNVSKAFFVIPLAAAFSERPRATAKWSVIAVVAYSAQAVFTEGHLVGSLNTWQRLTLSQDLYLLWTGAAATLLAIALRRRTSHTAELAASRQRLVSLAIESVERERTRLAGALHDSPVQNLIAARHELRRAERSSDPDSFMRLHEALDATIAELREEIFKLHPHVLDHVGLRAALEQVARRYVRDPNVLVELEIDGDASRTHRQVLFALGRELLGNAAKHAQAQEIRLRLAGQPDGGVTLEVTDDGRGIPDGRVRQALLDGHIGLASVNERVAAINGTLTIETASGAGTRVRVTLPAPEPAGPQPQPSLRSGDKRRHPASVTHRIEKRLRWRVADAPVAADQ